MNKEEVNKYIGKRIAFYRKRASIKQLTLAEIMGISKTQACKWEKGQVDISISKLYSIAETLKTTVIELLPIPSVQTLSEIDIEILSILEKESIDKNEVLKYIKFLTTNKQGK